MAVTQTKPVRNRLDRVVAVLCLLIAGYVVGCSLTGEVPLSGGDPDMGKKLYWEGVGRDGEPVPVTVQGDVQAGSGNFACVGCHRPSGFGSSEGGQFVPPITQPILFEESKADRERRNRRFRDLFKEKQGSQFDVRLRMPLMRPAYTDDSLAHVIRTGEDPTGRELDEAMPRYELDDRAMADLIAYLKTLSVEQSPGVGESKLHLATIVSDGVDPIERKAVIETQTLFTEWYNSDIQGQLQHRGFSPFYRSEFNDSYRLWELHVWELKGPPDTWRRQLREYYKEQPVFAVASGIVDGPWAPVDAFCNTHKLPCVFPNTDLPATKDAHYGYSLYFSRGLELEGEALADYLARRESPPRRIHQIRAGGPAGRVPARAFAGRAEAKLEGAGVTTRTVNSERALAEAIGRAAENGELEVLVVWPGEWTAVAVEALNRHRPGIDMISLASSALPVARERLTEALYDRVRLTHPYEKPGGYHPRKFRVRAWMHSRGLEVPHPRLQLQTYYAMSQLQFGIGHLVNDFHRDYLIEFIEHEAEAELNPGTHPDLALGPGQRFASKGAYIVALTSEPGDGYEAVSDWIVP